MPSEPSTDITRIILFILVVAFLIVGSAWTLLPFLSGLIWATTIALATWPMLIRLESLLGGRRSLAALIMTLLVLLVFVVPFVVAAAALVNAAQGTPALVNDFVTNGLGPPPAWIANIPVVGERISERWQTIASGGPGELAAAVQPYALSAATWVLAASGGVGRTIVLILLTVLIVAILYARGDQAATGALAFAHRLGGDPGERTIRLAAQAVRSVALGIIGTALIQSVACGIGLWICGVPRAGFLTAIAFVLGIAQLGPLPVMAPSAFWLYWSGNTTWAVVLLIWAVPVLTLDNFVRPILIRRGVQLPLLLIIAGVIGGLISFGVVGLFVGPVVLAATYTLTKDWVARGRAPATSP